MFMDCRIILLSLLVFSSIASQGIEPQLEITNPLPGTEISSEVLIEFHATGEQLSEEALIIQGPSGHQVISLDGACSLVEGEEDNLTCSVLWNSWLWEGEVSVVASVNSAGGVASDEVVVFVSGQNA